MRRMNKGLSFVLGMFLIAWGLNACASQPLFPVAVLKDADPVVDFGVLKAEPDTYKGRVLQLAGRIVGVEDTTDGTLIVVHELPIAEHPVYGPVETGVATGEFAVFFPGKLKPQDAVAGNRLVVIGRIQGSRSLRVQGVPQTVPYLVARCAAIWATGGEEIYTYLVRHGGDNYPQIEQTYCAS